MKRFVLSGAVLIALQLMMCQTSDAQSFSVEVGSSDIAGGVPPGDDILVPGPAPVLFGGTGLEVNGFTYGRSAPFSDNLSFIDFSVDALSAGVIGSAVFGESSIASGEQNYDVYRSGLTGTNILKHDGDGVGTPGFAAPLTMAEPQVVGPPPSGTGVDGYDNRAMPGPSIYWTWDSATVPLGPSASGADILFSLTGGGPYVPVGGPYATEAMLGLGTLGVGDNIDALEVWDIGAAVGVFDPGDIVLFSLDPTSPSLGVIGGGATPADILFAFSTGAGVSTGILITEGALGLAPGDNVTAISVPEATSAMSFMVAIGLITSRRRRRS